MLLLLAFERQPYYAAQAGLKLTALLLVLQVLILHRGFILKAFSLVSKHLKDKDLREFFGLIS